MQKDMGFDLLKYLKFGLPLGVLFAVFNPRFTSFSDYCIAIGAFIMAAVLWWIGDILVNRGSMVEAVCFDYDNQMLKLERTDWRNRKETIEIPYEGLKVGFYRGSISLKPRARFYNGNRSAAVLVFSFGWEENAYDKLEYQLRTHLANKIRK